MTTKSDKQTQTPKSQTQTQTNPSIRHAYSPQLKTPFKNTSPSMTKQSFKDECDINVIMGRYMRTGVLDFINKHQPRYEDLTEAADYQHAMLIVAESRSLFEDLPSSIRTKFENNPAKFLDFVHDPKNRPEMAEMGLLRAGTTITLPTPQSNPSAQPTPAAANPDASGDKTT